MSNPEFYRFDTVDDAADAMGRVRSTSKALVVILQMVRELASDALRVAQDHHDRLHSIESRLDALERS